MKKILPLDQLGEAAEQERRKGHSIARCHGVFDLVHPGHIAGKASSPFVFHRTGSQFENHIPVDSIVQKSVE